MSPLDLVEKQLGLSLKVTVNFLTINIVISEYIKQNYTPIDLVCYLFDETEQTYTVALELSTKYPRL